MDLVDTWTGRTACALQDALRFTNEQFASHLGASVRTVATWHSWPGRTPTKEMQQALDHVLDHATDTVRARFLRLATADQADAALAPTGDDGTGLALKVAIAVVTRELEVLVVQRRGQDGGGISWQFPAGVVKPGMSTETVAVRETYGETGVHCAVTRNLGGRVHPVTKVFCEYVLCEYLAGEPQNMDEIENVSVIWAPITRLTRFIPEDQIFPAILDALEAHSE